MISASKSTLNLNNLKILRPKVTIFFENLPKKLSIPTQDGSLILNEVKEFQDKFSNLFKNIFYKSPFKDSRYL
jgi:hypothetical protein